MVLEFEEKVESTVLNSSILEFSLKMNKNFQMQQMQMWNNNPILASQMMRQMAATSGAGGTATSNSAATAMASAAALQVGVKYEMFWSKSFSELRKTIFLILRIKN